MRKIPVEKIEDGMILAQDVSGVGGSVLIAKGSTLSSSLGRRLQNWGIKVVIVEGEDDNCGIKKTTSFSPEDLEKHLKEKFSNTLQNRLMKKIFESVYLFRIKKNI
ncbi:MAG: hypothetical protein N2053_06140 [Chitinispirillaceae bacterium]|nr:hypothetical protein [Chitinispirillaceae bacterium]